MVRIAFVSDTLHSYFGSGIEEAIGGAERQQALIGRELSNRGHDIAVATLIDPRLDGLEVDEVSIHQVIPDLRGVARAPIKAARTLRGLRSVDADVYYVRGNDFLCMVTALHARMSDAKFVYGVANDSNVDPEHLSGIVQYPYLAALNRADAVIAQTTHQQTLLNQHHGIESVVIPNGYDVPPESAVKPHDDRRHVLWVGSIDPEQKRPERFLKLARELPETTFRMIGPPDNDHPSYFAEIESRANQIENLEFLGYVEPDEIHEHYRDAIALVNTSDYEGFPNVFLEAWRYATPVVSLHHTLDDVLIEEPVGVHAGSMDALIEATNNHVQDISLRKRLGLGGREYMIENYSFSRVVDAYEDVFQ